MHLSLYSVGKRVGLVAATLVGVATGVPLIGDDVVMVDSPTERLVEVSASAGNLVGANRQEKDAAEAGKLRLREGTQLKNVAGRFRQSGDSLTFIDGQNREIGGLPNLNLERVSRVLQTVEEPESVNWSVSGAVTEYSGRNFLLITSAVFRSATPPPPPEVVAD